MIYSWASRSCTKPWTGTGAWMPCQYKLWAPGKYSSSGRTVSGPPWCKRLEGTTPPPFQGVTHSDTGQPPLVHHFQFHCGHRHAPLGDGGIRVGGSIIGTRTVDTVPHEVFLFQQHPDRIEMGEPDTTGLLFPRVPLLPFRPVNECPQYDDHGLPTVTLPWWHVVRVIKTPYDW